MRVTIRKEKQISRVSKKEQEDLPESEFAFPRQRKEPLENASHVRDAIARFDQVEGVTNEERDEAWRRIQSAANKFGVELHDNGTLTDDEFESQKRKILGG
jgi:cell division protein FtsX